jgi:hypothetical protein
MVDEFILYDDVQYTRRDWRNRNVIKTKAGLKWLTIPVEVKGNYLQKIKDTVISNPNWNREHWQTITHNYAKAKYLKDHKALFEDLYLGMGERYLSQINYHFLKTICGLLGIQTHISWSMEYRLVEGKTERLVDLCKQAGATEYISGPTAKGYINEGLFEASGITLKYVDYSGYPEYYQLFPPFEHHVSIVDLIFNMGPQAPKFMKSFF